MIYGKLQLSHIKLNFKMYFIISCAYFEKLKTLLFYSFTFEFTKTVLLQLFNNNEVMR
jgi:hypothetical protein